jgi:hypothetical protein
MKRLLLLSTLLLCTAIAQAKKTLPGPAEQSIQGTTAEELAALKARPLPTPGTIKVAILPFWENASKVDRQHTAAAVLSIMFSREGFQVLPLADSFKAAVTDRQIEPGQPLRKEDAIRIASTIGANWVVYGEIKELMGYKKESFLKSSKRVRAGARYAVADVATKELLYWKNDSVNAGGTGYFKGFSSKGAQLERTGLVALSTVILQPFFDALPAHATTGKPPESGEVASLMAATWPAPEKVAE